MTDYSSFYKRFILKIYYTPAAASSPALARARERLPGMPFIAVDDKEGIPAADRCQTTVFLTAGRGRPVGPCPGSKGHLCCNYYTVNLYEGCPIGCTYCIMRSYLNFLPVTVNVDTAAMLADIEALIALNPGRPLRLGTGETGDSLFYDPLFELSRDFIERLAPHERVSFELKTKTPFVDHLLAIEPKGQAVIGFSLNPPALVAAEEGCAGTLDERLAAAGRAAAAGYRLAFHFDPVIRIPGWEQEYEAVASRLAAFPPGRMAWISLGTMRYPKELLSRLGERPYLFDEFFPSRDGKHRYLRPLREGMYRSLSGWLRRSRAPIYLCMESPGVWKKVFGILPSENEALCGIFSDVKPLPYSNDKK